MRIIVTGVSNNGETTVIKDNAAEQYGPKTQAFESQFTHILGCDHPVILPSIGTQLDYGPSFFPVPGGFRFWLLDMPAHSAAPPAHAMAEIDGTAWADTVEWVIVLGGEIEYVLPSGERLLLKTGDSIVQIGAKHRWENTSDASCRMAVAAIGASAKEPSPWMNL